MAQTTLINDFNIKIFTVMPAIIIPFIPFGIWELRVPIAWSVNYLIERFNGIDDGQLTPGRNYQGRKFANQQGCLIDGRVISKATYR